MHSAAGSMTRFAFFLDRKTHERAFLGQILHTQLHTALFLTLLSNNVATPISMGDLPETERMDKMSISNEQCQCTEV